MTAPLLEVEDRAADLTRQIAGISPIAKSGLPELSPTRNRDADGQLRRAPGGPQMGCAFQTAAAPRAGSLHL